MHTYLPDTGLVFMQVKLTKNFLLQVSPERLLQGDHDAGAGHAAQQQVRDEDEQRGRGGGPAVCRVSLYSSPAPPPVTATPPPASRTKRRRAVPSNLKFLLFRYKICRQSQRCVSGARTDDEIFAEPQPVNTTALRCAEKGRNAVIGGIPGTQAMGCKHGDKVSSSYLQHLPITNKSIAKLSPWRCMRC